MKLFLALLLASFGSNVLIENDDDDENKIAEAIDRIQRFYYYITDSISHRFCPKKPRKKEIKLEESIVPENIEMKPMRNSRIMSLSVRQILHKPPDCCPTIISKHFSCCSKFIPKSIEEHWTYFRSLTHCFVEHRYFEWFIIFSILISSITLVS